MTPDQTLTQGDLLPVFSQQLVNADGTTPDLTGATVECRVQPTDRSKQAFVTPATIADPRSGFVTHNWSAAETAFPGFYAVQFRRTDGAFVQSWPPNRYYIVEVKAALAPPSLSFLPPPTPVPFEGFVDTVNTTGVTLSSVPAASFNWGASVFVIQKKAFFHIEIGQGYPVDHSTVEVALGLAGGQWVLTNPGVNARAGADLAPGNTTIQPTTDSASIYTLQLGTLVANGSVILGHAGPPVTSSIVQIIRRDLSAYTYGVKNWDGTLIPNATFVASPASPQGMSFYFDGTNYNLLSFYYVD
jgi:hypothetical protein